MHRSAASEDASSDRPRVFVTRRIPEPGLAALREVCDLDVWPDRLPPSYEELTARAAPCHGLLTMLSDRIDGALLEACPRLRVVSQYAVGTDNIDLAVAGARSVAVGNTPDVLTDATADLAFALMLSVARRVPEAAASVVRGDWRTWEPTGFLGADLVGATVGVVGPGRIGAAFARRCVGAFGMRLLYASRAEKPGLEQELGGQHVSLERLLRESDFVSLHCPLTAATRGLIGATAFAWMRPNAVLVNTARGPVVDTDALAAALRDGEIAGAALDVTDPEPLPADHPLLGLPNALVTPHVGSASVGARNAMAQIAAENVLAGLHGAPLPHAVAT